MEAILAIDSNNGLSKEGIIPWKSAKDLSFFYKKTKNNVVIMGKNTYLSLPDNVKPLKHRLNIVLTKTPDYFLNEPDTSDTNNNNIIFTNNENIHNSIIKNRENYKNFYTDLKDDFKIFFIGGKQIYEKYIPLCQTVWITRIKKNYLCDLIFHYNFEKLHKEDEIYDDNEINISKYIINN